MEMKRASVAMFFAILAAALLTHSDCRPLSNNSGMKSVTVSEQNDLTTTVPVNSAVEPFSFDPTNPCAGLSCDGVDDSICTVVVKCGNPIPVFLDALGRIAMCKNTQQRLDLKNITSPVPCPADPCSGASCSLYPEAMCFVTECSCKPIWLLPSGVEVNCLPVDKRRARPDAVSGSACAHL